MLISPIIYPKQIQIQNNSQNRNNASKSQTEQSSIFLAPNGQKAEKKVAFGEYEQKIAAQNNLVRRHEEAHLSSSGMQASGSPVYEKTMDQDGREIIKGGHQNIIVPLAVDKTASLKDISFTREAAKLVIKGAEAPAGFDELSDADKSVAFKGRSLLAQAETAKVERLLLQQKFGINPDQKASPEKLAQIEAQNKQTNPNQEKQAYFGKSLNMLG